MTPWPRANCGLVHLGYAAGGAISDVEFDVLATLDGLPMLVHRGAPSSSGPAANLRSS